MRSLQSLEQEHVAARRAITGAVERGGLRFGDVVNAMSELIHTYGPVPKVASEVAWYLGAVRLDDYRALLKEAAHEVSRYTSTMHREATRELERADADRGARVEADVCVEQLRRRSFDDSSVLLRLSCALQAIAWAAAPPGEPTTKT